jgi:hypothetical protein
MRRAYTIGLLAVLWIVYGAPSPAYAAPSIAGVSGSIVYNQSITITGSGFGAGPTVWLFDDFDGGTVGQDIYYGTGSAVIGQWDRITRHPEYSDDTSVSGTKSFKSTTTAHLDSSHESATIHLPGASSAQTFVSYWAYVPAGTPWPGEGGNGTNWKMTWISQNDAQPWVNDMMAPAMMLLDEQPPAPIYVLSLDDECARGIGDGCSPGWWDYPATEYWRSSASIKGQWFHIWYWVKAASDNTGVFRVWELKDSGPTLMKDVSNHKTVNTNGYHEWLIINGYTAENFTEETYQYFDDVYVATGPNAQARIEIGNASTYAASTNLTVITPTSWADGSITSTVRRGSFGATDNAYLYVIDSDGNVSSGYPVTFGNTYGAPSLSPGVSVSGGVTIR